MSLLNRKGIRDYILRAFRELRPGMRITRVAPHTLDNYERRLKNWIRDDVERHPSRGQTFTEQVSMLNHDQ